MLACTVHLSSHTYVLIKETNVLTVTCYVSVENTSNK